MFNSLLKLCVFFLLYYCLLGRKGVLLGGLSHLELALVKLVDRSKTAVPCYLNLHRRCRCGGLPCLDMFELYPSFHTVKKVLVSLLCLNLLRVGKYHLFLGLLGRRKDVFPGCLLVLKVVAP